METKEGKYYTEYRRARNQVRKLTRRIQKEFEMKLATESKTNPKAGWKYMNSKTKNREGVSDLNIDLTYPKSRLTNSDWEKADVLGHFVSSVFTIESYGSIHRIPPVKLRHTMEALTIDEETIKQLDNRNVCKSVGPDGVHPRVLEELSNHLCKPLARLFNNSLAVGELPKEWKQGRISAIFKKGSRKNAYYTQPNKYNMQMYGTLCQRPYCQS